MIVVLLAAVATVNLACALAMPTPVTTSSLAIAAACFGFSLSTRLWRRRFEGLVHLVSPVESQRRNGGPPP